MRLSFIIPVYNAADHIKACTDSIFRLSEFDPKLSYELVFIDDGSTDDSLKLLEEIKESRSGMAPVTIFQQENHGVSFARNKGIELSNYEYIIFADADDTFDSKLLFDAIKAQDMYPDIDLIAYGISFDYYLKGVLYREDEILPPYSAVIKSDEWKQDMYRLFTSNVLSSLWNKIIRKSILTDHNIILDEDMIIYEDLQFSLDLMKYCDSILFIQEPVYHYKQFEDHAGKRLHRISHLYTVIGKIDKSLSYIDEAQKRSILVLLYRYLISEKVRTASLADVTTICRDFRRWIDHKSYQSYIDNNKYLEKVYMQKALWIYTKGKYSYVRHRFANYIKLILHIEEQRNFDADK